MAQGRRARRPMTFHAVTGGFLRALATQFLLGMILNLYVVIPFPSPLTTAATLGIVVLGLHIAVGVMVLVFAFWMVLKAYRSPGRRGLGLSLVAALSVLASFIEGASFTFMYQSALDSFIMALGFYLALMAGLLLYGRPEDTAGAERSAPQP